jgi:hypothetical protein
MNISYQPVPIDKVPPAMEQAGYELIKAMAFALIPAELLYFSIYFHTKGAYKVYKILTFLSLSAFWISPYAAPIVCGPVRCLQNFASMTNLSSSFLDDMLTAHQLLLAQ